MDGTAGLDRRTQVIAHRGYHAGGATENSLESFHAGVALGVDLLEIDVQRTRDGVLVIHHDSALADGRTIAELDAAQLPTLANGEPIPTLAQTADLARSTGVRLQVEFKGTGYEQQAVSELFSRLPTGQVEVISFNDESIEAVEAIDPSIRTGLLEQSVPGWLRDTPLRPAAVWLMEAFGWHPALTSAARVGADYVSVEQGVATPRFLEAARDRDMPVDVWTVDDPNTMRRLLAEGVQGIVTDRPDLALQLRDGTDRTKARPVQSELPVAV